MKGSRRRFLGWIAAGAVVGGASIAALRSTGYSIPREIAQKLVVLSPWQYVVIDAFGRRMLDPESADVAAFADGYFVGLADADRRDLLAFVAYVEHLAPLAAGHTKRFSSLGPDAQDEVLESLEQSSIDLLRGGFQALKAVAMMAYYRRPASWPALGYGGPVVLWQG